MSTGVRRVAMVSVHTSPLDSPGGGDAGGMNVYIDALAEQLAGSGVLVDVFTRSAGAMTLTGQGGYRVVGLPAGPPGRVAKEDLPDHLTAFAEGVQTADLGPYDLVHSHYWLSGQVGMTLAAAWDVPLVHMMHTMAAVKNARSATVVEPARREVGERRLATSADALVVSTGGEGHDMVDHYGAPPERIHVVAPGVDLQRLTPAAEGEPPWRPAGLPTSGRIVLFAGRIQPHKGPDLLVRALAEMRAQGRVLPTLVVLGGSSGSSDPRWLDDLAAELGVREAIVRHDPVPHDELAGWYRAADLVAVPSHHESFGLVALEAQACGVPVVAAAVGGLVDAVADGRSGVLVLGRDPAEWARVIGDLLTDDERRRRLAAGARAHAERFSWRATAAATAAVYAQVVAR